MNTKFPGVLNKHRAARQAGGLLEDSSTTAEKHAAWAVEDYNNLQLLREHYEIAEGPDQYYFLALRLAHELVPCFQEKAREGRRRKWDGYSLGVLAVEVERLTGAGLTLDQAARQIAGRDPWRLMLDQWGEGKSFGADPGGAILQAYKSAKKSRWTDLVRTAFKSHELAGTIDRWDKEVTESK